MFLKIFFSKKKSAEIADVPLLTITYKGFSVFYSEGTSLIERIKKTGDYEPDVTDCILSELNSIPSPVIVDIGANIGLISLSILAKIQKAEIWAFEPGPHQNELFEKTIQENLIADKIHLSNLALSDKKGEATFRIHSTSDASGDGFVDTERAGPTKSIIVKTDTLDNWWFENKKPKIDFIKMDTEGSEFLILKGASELIKQLKPKMLIEINRMNLRNYPFSLNDLMLLISSYGYELYSLEKEVVNETNLEKHLSISDTFLLLPSE